MAVDHWRPRKTGPRHPLMVVRCSVHHVAFTVYPPGHVPYGRVPLMHVGSDGSTVRDATWTGTLFEAAIDAAEGRAWERPVRRWNGETPDPALVVPGDWSTQLSRLDLGVRCLGLASDLPGPIRYQIARALGVDTLLLRETCAWMTAGGYQARGQAVRTVLDALGPTPKLDRLLHAGHLAGAWGRPWKVLAGSRRLVAFRPAGTPPAGGTIRSSTRSTKGARSPPVTAG